MIIYPKTDENLNGAKFLKPYILKYKGLEIQMLSWEKLYKIEDIVTRIKEEFPELKELTIHPPLLETFNFEVLSYSKFEQEKERIKIIKKLSGKYKMKINLLYHTRWNYVSWKESGCIER